MDVGSSSKKTVAYKPAPPPPPPPKPAPKPAPKPTPTPKQDTVKISPAAQKIYESKIQDLHKEPAKTTATTTKATSCPPPPPSCPKPVEKPITVSLTPLKGGFDKKINQDGLNLGVHGTAAETKISVKKGPMESDVSLNLAKGEVGLSTSKHHFEAKAGASLVEYSTSAGVKVGGAKFGATAGVGLVSAAAGIKGEISSNKVVAKITIPSLGISPTVGFDVSW